MVTAKQLKVLDWAIKTVEVDQRELFKQDYEETATARVVEQAKVALAQVHSDYRSARLLRRQAVPAPRRALQRVGAK